MAHPRNRVVLALIKKHLKFFPVVALQGARQTGKSFLTRELLAPHFSNSCYLSFDDETIQAVAEQSAKTFLLEYNEFRPLMIDEAQKAPSIFNAIKLKVDLKRVPGEYLLLGSTEFSREALIRESLTGRLGKVRIFPMTIEEVSPGRVDTKTLLQYLTQGGLPGICFVREERNRIALMRDWINLTCQRDLQQFKKLKLDGLLASRILKLTATLKEPTRAEIAKALKVNHKRVQTHINALVELFALTRLDPHPSGGGKTIFLPFDAGIAHYLGADRERCLHIWLLNELLVRDVCKNTKPSSFYYYRSSGKNWIHVIEENDSNLFAHQIITHENIEKRDSELMKAFLKKNKTAKGVVRAPVNQKIKLNVISYVPWLFEPK